MRALTRKPARTSFLPECLPIRRRPRTSVCLWTASRERKLRRRGGTRRDPHGSRILTGHNRPPGGRAAYVAGGERHHRNQRSANRERDWRIAIDGVEVGGAAARAG